MSDHAVSISLSEEERLFVHTQIAAGKYADDAEMLHAGLAALEREERLQTMRASSPQGDADLDPGERVERDGNFAQYITSHAAELRGQLANAERSGESGRTVPEIMTAVKTKLRANGTL